MSIDVTGFRGSDFSKSDKSNKEQIKKSFNGEIFFGNWPKELSGHVFIVGPQHRQDEHHLFGGTGAVVRWDLQANQDGCLKVHWAPVKTWDSFWQKNFRRIWDKPVFPASISLLGVAELANTAIFNLNGRMLLTADAGRYWEINPETLETITPVGYFDEYIITVPGLAFPMVMNTAHPFVINSDKGELLSCQLRARPRFLTNFLGDMVCRPYIYRWDGEGKLQHWELRGIDLDGCTHSVLVTQKCVLVPDIPFQMGLSTLLGLKIPPAQAYKKTQLYVVDRSDLKAENNTVPARLVSFPGDSYHFLCNYQHTADDHIQLCAIQQSTISLTEAIQKGDINHFTGKPFERKYYGIPWMFGFEPGILRQVKIRVDPNDTGVDEIQTFVHPGWWCTQLSASDSQEQLESNGYSAIYQGYGGFSRDLLSRRQYLEFRDHPNRYLNDKEEDPHWIDLPSVLACIPLGKDWNKLTEELKKELEVEQAHHPNHPLDSCRLVELGRAHLDFYVFPEGHTLNSMQFIPEGKGYVFTTVLVKDAYEAWLFDAKCLKKGPIAKVRLLEGVNFGFMLHSEYFQRLNTSERPPYCVNRTLSDLSAIKALIQFIPQTLFSGFS